MIYEIRTYTLKPGSVQAYEENFAEALSERIKLSPLAAFWHTEIGPLNQVVHLWPYNDANHRSQVRGDAVSDGIWPPDNSDLILNMQSDIMVPAVFMKPLEARNIGPIYEMRIYTYRPGDIDAVLEAWARAIEEREKYSPLVGCWSSDVGALNRFVHMWAYTSFEERTRVRTETRAAGVWPPQSGVVPLAQENKILLPYDFSHSSKLHGPKKY